MSPEYRVKSYQQGDEEQIVPLRARKYGFSGGEANRHFFYNNWGYEGKRLENISPEKFHFSFGDLTGI